MTDLINNIIFNLEYAVTVIIIIVVIYLILKKNIEINILLLIFIGLVVKSISLFIMSLLFPAISSTSNSVYQYFLFRSMNNFTATGYMHVWPPILAVLVIFIILVYNKKLG